jgi:hypothetical protein
MRTVIEALAALGGVASTSSLQQAWVSRRSIEAGVRAAAVQRVSRGVNALPNSDPMLVYAGHHAVPGFVTAAPAAGLWSSERPVNRIWLHGMAGRSVVAWCTGAPYHRRIWTSCARPYAACRRLGLAIAESAVRKGLIQLPALRERFPAVREQAIVRLVRQALAMYRSAQ